LSGTADLSDDLKQIPEQIEALVGDKRFLQAANLLVKSLKTINKPEISNIGAVSDLRGYLSGQETVGRLPSGLTIDVDRHFGGGVTQSHLSQDVLQRLSVASICSRTRDTYVRGDQADGSASRSFPT
jgi:hypothetical protein